MTQIAVFNPIVDENSKVLILGTMPSVISIEKNEYYANPKNQFWDIIHEIFNSMLNGEYEQKVAFLKNNKIALWDVLYTCEREGSLDKNIKNEKPNDFADILKRYPNISYIIFNGSTAYKLFKRYIGFNIKTGIKYKQLPSTSPIPGKNVKTFDEKIQDWKIIIDFLND